MNRRLKKARRWNRIIQHQDDITPFAQWGTLHIGTSFDVARLRRRFHELNASGHSFVSFLEQSRRGKRPHLHFLFKSRVSHDEFRQYAIDCLSRRKGKPPLGISKRIRLQIKDIIPHKRRGLFRYVTKATPRLQKKVRPLASGMQTVFAVGDVWDKPTTELAKLTEKDIERKLVWNLMGDQELLMQIMNGDLTADEVRRPHFFYYWHRGQYGRRYFYPTNAELRANRNMV